MIESKERCAQRQQHKGRQVQKVMSKVDSLHFLNLLTGPELLERIEVLSPEYRERKYPPTVTLSMFLGQVLSADGSCQNAVNQAMVSRLTRGLPADNANTNAYCMARQRLPQEMIRELARRVAAGPDARTPQPGAGAGGR